MLHFAVTFEIVSERRGDLAQWLVRKTPDRVVRVLALNRSFSLSRNKI